MVATKAQTGRGQDNRKVLGFFFAYGTYGKNSTSAKLLEVSLLGIGAVLHLERDA